MFIQATAIFVGSNMAIQWNAFWQNYVKLGNKNYDATVDLGAAYPLIFVMIIVSYFASRNLFKYSNELTRGIKAVSEGDFTAHLNEKKGGPYTEVYKNFNKMTAELNSVETLRDDFINKFSHEFKTPISSINGFAELLLKQDVDPADQKIYLDIIAKESARLSELANNVMILTALESQEIVLHREKFDLEEQVKQAAIAFLPQLTAKHIQLDIATVPATFFGNADIMQHVWMNLLSNALKFTPVDGRIKITMRQSAHGIHVTFNNNGPLIDETTQKNIFTKFYQEDKTGIEKGLGLGLSIAKRVLDLSGGTITVVSHQAIGTDFIVSLPKK